MTREQAETLIKLALIPQDAERELGVDMAGLPMYKALRLRVSHNLTVRLGPKVLTMICAVSFGKIGVGIMYLYYLQWWAKKRNVKEVTWDDLTMRIFPMGFLNDDSLHTVWEGQKVKRPAPGNMQDQFHSDNLLDYPEAAKSIMTL